MTTSNQPMKGNIKTVHHSYAWVVGDDGRAYFMHESAMQKFSDKGFKDLQRNDRIEFLAVDAAKGPRAIEVRSL